VALAGPSHRLGDRLPGDSTLAQHSNMRSIMWPATPLVVGPIDRLHYADSVRRVVGEHAMRAGDNHGAIDELGRRLLLRLHAGESVYAACTLDLPDRGPAVVLATDRRLLASAGFWGDHWNLDAPWDRVGGARVTATDIRIVYELLVDGVRIQLTGQPQHGAAPLVALTAHVLAARPTVFD
jgi:hypothetical protein